jgi:hypothetical protein
MTINIFLEVCLYTLMLTLRKVKSPLIYHNQLLCNDLAAFYIKQKLK